MKRFAIGVLSACVALGLGGCVANETKMGGGSTKVTGSAGAGGNQDEAQELVRCARPLGTAALVEPDSPHWGAYGLKSPVPLLRLMMAQSGCFQVVDRGQASAALERERALASQGELRRGSSMGGGQMVAADFLITPNIVHQDADAGGGFGGLGALLPGVAGAVAGGIRTSNLEAQTVLFLTNVRSGVQEAVAEGSATKRDMDFGLGGWAGGVAGIGGGYQDTEVGKIVAAAFLDAHNNLVSQMQAMRPESVEMQKAAGGGYQTTAGVNFRAGPSTSASVLGTLAAGTRVVPTGETRGSWWAVEANGREGWIHSNFIAR